MCWACREKIRLPAREPTSGLYERRGCLRLILGFAVCGPVAAEVVELVVLEAALAHALRHESLQLVEMVGVDLARQGLMLGAETCGHTHDLAHHARGAHYAHCPQTDVCYADVAPSHEEVVDVARIEAAIGYGVGVHGAVRAYRLELLAREVFRVLGVGIVQVDAPCGGERCVGDRQPRL